MTATYELVGMLTVCAFHTGYVIGTDLFLVLFGKNCEYWRRVLRLRDELWGV